MRHRSKKLLSILLSLVLVLGLMPGMSLTAYAAPPGWGGGLDIGGGGIGSGGPSVTITPAGGGTVTVEETTFGGQPCWMFTATPAEGYSFSEWTWFNTSTNQTLTSTNNPTKQLKSTIGNNYINFTAVFEAAPATVPVTSVTLPGSATVAVGGDPVGLTATVEPVEATDQKVKWSTTGGVKLYSDINCETEVGTDATETRTVYVKPISAGDATVTVTSNADSSKYAECAVLVNAAHTHNWGYDARGRSITPYCRDSSCDYYWGAGVLTINAPANLECDGSAKEATISGQIPGGSGLPDPSGITYTPGGSTAPTEPGDYTASFTWGSATASVSFTLTAPQPTTYTVTYKVVNGTWADGTTADKTETVQSGSKPASVPTGMIASSGFTGGAWNTNPADATITAATTFTYTFTAIPTYTVTVANTPNGTVTASKATAAAGEPINLTITPDVGYQVQACTVTDVNNNNIPVTNNSFIMPAANAVVTVTFIPIPVTTYTVSFAPNGGGGEMAPVQVQAGSTYNLPNCGFTAPAGQRFKSWLLGSTEFAPGAPIIVDCPATFVALWEDIPVTLYTVTAHPGENGAAGVSQNAAAPGTLITVDAIPFGGYDVASIAWSVDGGQTGIDITDTASFVMPAANVDVFVVFRPVGGGGGGGAWDGFGGGYYAPQQAYRVILAPTENGSALLVVSNGQTSTEMYVYPTTEVRVTTTPAPGFVVDKIVWSLIDGSASYDITQAGAFLMPAMDVVVHVTFKPLGA